MAEWHIGVIGGSGLYEPGKLEDVQEIAVNSAFGEPSSPVLTGTLHGVKFTFLARHGAGHTRSPSHVNYRANVDVLKRCGVTDILAISAIGSLREEFAPGDFVAVDQIIDRTAGRERSFFGEGIVAHVPLADPVCPRLSDLAAKAGKKAGATMHDDGIYVAIEGPQFSTRAESHLYRDWGANVIGMTAMPEARLAREAELPYALIGMVTDYDCWRDSEEDVDVTDILKVMKGNGETARKMLGELAKALPKSRKASPIDTILDVAIVTPREEWDIAAAAKLDAVASRLIDLFPAPQG
ncbi:S-methyl-5'-thioadenosine phosphorylase [Aurantiacibacter gangjinensis]|uniref:S-methyl-5'-thioadenosine phosphorylase n=1 Tax=Aurantiacibacter gangjinensis TaxID=502682 RepID=A0A0G9MRZ1_9SPHN|nr:S-methyl-5'-thioadenosine phosphorylase [Aurantiacibacter gangjinensis]APE27075.1 5'-methylthioadenosine phosphorylase [Aurantiacibacter gangjinensis]KLE33497.1 5'-methylthioadenosine phosphorylase [Aurantiacibacter gangjinensis]